MCVGWKWTGLYQIYKDIKDGQMNTFSRLKTNLWSYDYILIYPIS